MFTESLYRNNFLIDFLSEKDYELIDSILDNITKIDLQLKNQQIKNKIVENFLQNSNKLFINNYEYAFSIQKEAKSIQASLTSNIEILSLLLNNLKAIQFEILNFIETAYNKIPYNSISDRYQTRVNECYNKLCNAKNNIFSNDIKINYFLNNLTSKNLIPILTINLDEEVQKINENIEKTLKLKSNKQASDISSSQSSFDFNYNPSIENNINKEKGIRIPKHSVINLEDYVEQYKQDIQIPKIDSPSYSSINLDEFLTNYKNSNQYKKNTEIVKQSELKDNIATAKLNIEKRVNEILNFVNDLTSSEPSRILSRNIRQENQKEDTDLKINNPIKENINLKIDIPSENDIDLTINKSIKEDINFTYNKPIKEDIDLINNKITKEDITNNYIEKIYTEKHAYSNDIENESNVIKETASNVAEKISCDNFEKNVIDTKENSTDNKEDICNSFNQNNKTLRISEKLNKVFLPYTISEINSYLEQYPDYYSSAEDVIEKEFVLPLKYYISHPVNSRFREAYSLIRDREGKSFFEAFKFAINLMFRYDLNPAIIAACKTQAQLEKYIDCLNYGNLDNFSDFEIKFEINPL